jgi:hypothetical protein
VQACVKNQAWVSPGWYLKDMTNPSTGFNNLG